MKWHKVMFKGYWLYISHFNHLLFLCNKTTLIYTFLLSLVFTLHAQNILRRRNQIPTQSKWNVLLVKSERKLFRRGNLLIITTSRHFAIGSAFVVRRESCLFCLDCRPTVHPAHPSRSRIEFVRDTVVDDVGKCEIHDAYNTTPSMLGVLVA